MIEKTERPDFSNVDEFTEALVLVIESAVDKEQLRMIRDLLATEESGLPDTGVANVRCEACEVESMIAETRQRMWLNRNDPNVAVYLDGELFLQERSLHYVVHNHPEGYEEWFSKNIEVQS